MLGEKVIHLADAPADDNYRNTTLPEILQLGEFGGLRTLLMVPCGRTMLFSASSPPFAWKFGRSPTSRSRSCRTSPRRRSSRLKTRA